MRRSLPVLLLGSALVFGCEDGPDKLFTPFEGDPAPQNGYEPTADSWTAGVDGPTKGYDTQTGGDSVGRAQFCDEDVRTAQIQDMIVKPIIPDVSVGGVPLWGPDDTPLPADNLLGLPEDGLFCDPTGVYADAFTWGPTDELIVWFDQETRLVTGIMAYQQYLGTMEAEYTLEDGSTGSLTIQTRERLLLDGVELDRYASGADAPMQDNAWMNPVNASKIYKAVRETFFNADPFPDDYDCFVEQTCNLIYTTSNEQTPQDTFIWFPDSGFQIRMTPEGQVIFVYIEPVRSAPFESQGSIAFAPVGDTAAFTFDSTLRPNCSLDLSANMTWGDFKANCIASGDERVINRVNYNVSSARDAVQAEFNTINLNFLRRTSMNPLLGDGEQPMDGDVLYGISFSRSNAAAVAEFVPANIVATFKTMFEQRLKDAIIATGTTTMPQNHPYWTYTVDISGVTATDPERVGQILDANGGNFIPDQVNAVRAIYDNLTDEQRGMLNPDAGDELFLLESYIDALLSEFTHGKSAQAGAVTQYIQTNDRRWSIGTAHFLEGTAPQRIQVQYSLDYGGLSFVSVSRGYSDVDNIMNIALNQVGSTNNYFEAADILRGGHLLTLGSEDFSVTGFDRQLGTLDIRYQVGLQPQRLTITGEPIQDLSGYLKQIRGQRWEFIPADVLYLYGKETSMIGYVDENGVMSRIEMGGFKGQFPLCNGLLIQYGDNVPRMLSAWEKTVSTNDYRDCELVFNYSENGNVLLSIASLTGRRRVVLENGRATQVGVWQ